MVEQQAPKAGNQEVAVEAEITVEHEKNSAWSHVEALLEEERRLSFLDVCHRYPKIVWWSFFWCMTAVACMTRGLAHDTKID